MLESFLVNSTHQSIASLVYVLGPNIAASLGAILLVMALTAWFVWMIR